VTAAKHEGTALADELPHRLGQAVGQGATVSTVFGEAVERDGITVIPVAKARFGFGGGGGAGGRGVALDANLWPQQLVPIARVVGRIDQVA